MPYREQPASLGYAPPAYPGHDYTGEGEIVVLRLGRGIVGWMSRKGWGQISFAARPDLSDDEHILRRLVEGIIRGFAADRRPMVDAWAEVLNLVAHDAPKIGMLEPLRGLATRKAS
jgi:hypothetical protein